MMPLPRKIAKFAGTFFKDTVKMNRLAKIWNYMCCHKYLITTAVFLIIIVFIDDNNLIRRIRYQYEIITLRKEIKHYQSIYDKDTERLNELLSNPKAIEKIARERYLMKTPDEDIYIFEDKSKLKQDEEK